MKHFLLSIILSFFLAFTASAQSFTLDPISIELTIEPTDADVIGHGLIKNQTEDSVVLYWEVMKDEADDGWAFYVCDRNLCYGPATVRCPEDKPVVLAPDSISVLDLHHRPNGIEASSKIRIRVWEVGNEANEGTVTYLANQTTDVEDIPDAAISIYPNPTENFFKISNNDHLHQITITNIVGKPLKTLKTMRGAQYDIKDLPTGLYLVRMMDIDNKVLKTVRLSKR